MSAASKIALQIDKLEQQIAVLAPNSYVHAQALSYQGYTLLSLSRKSKRPEVKLALSIKGYGKRAASVRMKLDCLEPSLDTVFSAYNLAINLIVEEKRSGEGMHWMNASQQLLEKIAGKKKLTKNLLFFKLYSIDYGMAQARYDIGQPMEARTILRRALSLAPALNKTDWATLSGIAKCSELLSLILMEEMQRRPVPRSKSNDFGRDNS